MILRLSLLCLFQLFNLSRTDKTIACKLEIDRLEKCLESGDLIEKEYTVPSESDILQCYIRNNCRFSTSAENYSENELRIKSAIRSCNRGLIIAEVEPTISQCVQRVKPMWNLPHGQKDEQEQQHSQNWDVKVAAKKTKKLLRNLETKSPCPDLKSRVKAEDCLWTYQSILNSTAALVPSYSTKCALRELCLKGMSPKCADVFESESSLICNCAKDYLVKTSQADRIFTQIGDCIDFEIKDIASVPVRYSISKYMQSNVPLVRLMDAFCPCKDNQVNEATMAEVEIVFEEEEKEQEQEEEKSEPVVNVQNLEAEAEEMNNMKIIPSSHVHESHAASTHVHESHAAEPKEDHQIIASFGNKAKYFGNVGKRKQKATEQRTHETTGSRPETAAGITEKRKVRPAVIKDINELELESKEIEKLKQLRTLLESPVKMKSLGRDSKPAHFTTLPMRSVDPPKKVTKIKIVKEVRNQIQVETTTVKNAERPDDKIMEKSVISAFLNSRNIFLTIRRRNRRVARHFNALNFSLRTAKGICSRLFPPPRRNALEPNCCLIPKLDSKTNCYTWKQRCTIKPDQSTQSRCKVSLTTDEDSCPKYVVHCSQ